jgi:hypothetical protein
MSKPIFSFGVSRGGTTFFARILSVNKEIKIASDPLLPLFRAFRNEILKQKIDQNFDCSQALDDYYFSDEKIKVMKTIQATSLTLPFPQNKLREIRSRLAERMGLAAKELVCITKEIRGKNFLELFKNSLSAMEKVYQAKNISWCGSHDNWVIEFLPILARSFSRAKFISIIRDPRAAIASSLKNRETDPKLVPLMYSFAHHWRKHAAFTWKLMHDHKLKDRIFVIRYEDLVLEPVKKTKQICKFLGVDYNPDMLITNNFRPLAGNKWTTYSNFKVPKNKIYTNSIDSWKKHLDKGTIEFIEFVCDPEMRLFKYDLREYQGGFPSAEIMKFFIKDDKLARGWRGVHQSWDREQAHELFRKQALTKTGDFLDRKTVERYFLFPEVFHSCKKL